MGRGRKESTGLCYCFFHSFWKSRPISAGSTGGCLEGLKLIWKSLKGKQRDFPSPPSENKVFGIKVNELTVSFPIWKGTARKSLLTYTEPRQDSREGCWGGDPKIPPCNPLHLVLWNETTARNIPRWKHKFPLLGPTTYRGKIELGKQRPGKEHMLSLLCLSFVEDDRTCFSSRMCFSELCTRRRAAPDHTALETPGNLVGVQIPPLHLGSLFHSRWLQGFNS